MTLARSKTVRGWLAALMLASVIAEAAAPAAAVPLDEGRERDLTLTLLTLDMAQTACAVRVVQPRLAALLASAGVTRADLYGRPITPALQAAIDGLQGRFVRDRAAACADAWRRFGPASEAGLLTR
jgi:hypothetical protein